uniref:Uncharacterized protein n=1 Tax=Rhizophora mucronata TaxID=61149 RepID=A0A2P2P8P4_RHIMU
MREKNISMNKMKS